MYYFLRYIQQITNASFLPLLEEGKNKIFLILASPACSEFQLSQQFRFHINLVRGSYSLYTPAPTPRPVHISGAFWWLWIRPHYQPKRTYSTCVQGKIFFIFLNLYPSAESSFQRDGRGAKAQSGGIAARCRLGLPSAPSPAACVWVPSLPCKCWDCDCVWDFFLEVHLSLLLFLFSVGLIWGGSSFVVRYLSSSEQGRLWGFCCWQMLLALLLHEFSVLKTRHKEKAKISELNLIRMDIGFLKRWDFQWSVQSKCTRSMSCE